MVTEDLFLAQAILLANVSHSGSPCCRLHLFPSQQLDVLGYSAAHLVLCDRGTGAPEETFSEVAVGRVLKHGTKVKQAIRRMEVKPSQDFQTG